MMIVIILSHSEIMLSLLMLSNKTVTGAYEHKNERRMRFVADYLDIENSFSRFR